MESKPCHKIRTKFVKTLSVPLGILIGCGFSGKGMLKIQTNPLGILNILIPPIIPSAVLSALAKKPDFICFTMKGRQSAKP